jgi:hypothetical protein
MLKLKYCNIDDVQDGLSSRMKLNPTIRKLKIISKRITLFSNDRTSKHKPAVTLSKHRLMRLPNTKSSRKGSSIITAARLTRKR